MNIPKVACSVCGKFVLINECIMEKGKAFCSEKCYKGTPESGEIKTEETVIPKE